MANKFKIKKGDQLIVLAGKYKGQKGEILRMVIDTDRAIVSGVNVAKRHERASHLGAGGIVDKEQSIHVSNLALVDPKSGKATRVGYKKLDNGEKVRFAKQSGEMIA